AGGAGAGLSDKVNQESATRGVAPGRATLMGVQWNGRTLAILGFHKIGPAPDGWETWFYVPQATFAGYLACLKEEGWQVLDAAAFLRGLAEPDGLPGRAALITFDDGYRSILDYGLPELRLLRHPAGVVVPT